MLSCIASLSHSGLFVKSRLKNQGFKDEADLDDILKKLDTSIKRARNKELGIEETEEKVCKMAFVCSLHSCLHS